MSFLTRIIASARIILLPTIYMNSGYQTLGNLSVNYFSEFSKTNSIQSIKIRRRLALSQASNESAYQVKSSSLQASSTVFMREINSSFCTFYYHK